MTVGSTTVAETNYAANSLPEVAPTCDGGSVTLTTAGMSLGIPSGASYLFPIGVSVAGSAITPGNVAVSFSISSQITSIKVA